MAIQVGGTIYRVNKYLIIKSFKRLLVDKFSDHWPEFYGSDDGLYYDDWMLMKDIDCSLMVIWSIINYKDFKVGIEGTVVAKVTLNRNIIVREILKINRKRYELGKDIVLMVINSKKYSEDETIYRYRKNLWLSRKRNEKSPKACVIKDHKIIIEVNGVETLFDGKLCSI
jgi:hypothetical protein